MSDMLKDDGVLGADLYKTQFPTLNQFSGFDFNYDSDATRSEFLNMFETSGYKRGRFYLMAQWYCMMGNTAFSVFKAWHL